LRKFKKEVIVISEVTIDDDGKYINIKTTYSVGAIETCFENEGYCVMTDLGSSKEYMITPKSVVLVKAVS
jgi:hypothetical protein